MKRLAGFAVVAAAGVVLMRLLVSLLGLVFSLLSALVWIALLGTVLYLGLKIANPDAAERVRNAVRRETTPDEPAS